ncbi:MAG: glutathione S-transferase, partial [Caulobacteraceae bacterium]
MITVWGEGRGFRVVWLLEEIGLPYRLRPVDLLAGAENDPEFMAINPAGFIPALVDGDVTMVESIAIMEYLMARYGPTPLAPAPSEPTFPAYQQFLHLGEAGLAASIYFVNSARNLAPESERDNHTARHALETFETRLEAGDTAAGARGLHGRRDIHRGRCLGDLCPAARPEDRGLRPRGCRAGLCGPNQRPRRL